MTVPDLERTIWFHRAFKGVTGGEVKHSQYFAHARELPGVAVRIAFTGGAPGGRLAAQRREFWPLGVCTGVERWAPGSEDVLFVAGTDWRYLDAMGLRETGHQRINLVQGVRHADPGTQLYRYLQRPAVRICVSAEVADAIAATRLVRGPIVAIPNSTDLPPWEVNDSTDSGAWEARTRPVTIVGYKRPDLSMALSRRLEELSIPHELVTGFRERDAFLKLLRETRVAVCLPNPTEGFYLPALEAMASGCVVVTLDAIGNRGFCFDGEDCFVARDDAGSLAHAVGRAARLGEEARSGLLARAAQTVAAHGLHVERSRFRAVLGDMDRLWAEAGQSAVIVPPSKGDDARTSPATPEMSYRPRLAFMIVGAQKCGTTALAQFLDAHPEIGMSSVKEEHLFDYPEYSREWTAADIDARYRPHFAHRRFHGRTGETVLGEATPVYLFLPQVAAELKRYNAELKLLVLVRDPVRRAISHYYMERGRGGEHRPLWLALLLEPFRLRRSRDPRHRESAYRLHSYRARGLYSRQLRNLYRCFDRERVFILRAEDLLREHEASLRRVFAFLGVSREVRVSPDIVFEGERGARKHRFVSFLLRLSYLPESARLRAVIRESG